MVSDLFTSLDDLVKSPKTVVEKEFKFPRGQNLRFRIMAEDEKILIPRNEIVGLRFSRTGQYRIVLGIAADALY
jgi:hypothetical protein